MKRILATLAVIGLTISCFAQVNTNTPPSFFSTAINYFTSFNTNLDTTFTTDRGQVWTGVDSIQGGKIPLANSLGISTKIWGALGAESVTRNSGIAGTVVSEQIGLNLNWTVHDTQLTVYADGGYEFLDEEGISRHFVDRLFAEIGARVKKALSERTFAGVSIAAQLPRQEQIASVFGGFTF